LAVGVEIVDQGASLLERGGNSAPPYRHPSLVQRLADRRNTDIQLFADHPHRKSLLVESGGANP
jgi:hypothetical protein